MPISGYYDASLAKLLMDWLSSARWTEALFTLIGEYLGGSDAEPAAQGKFSADGDGAASQKRALHDGLSTLTAGDSENPAIPALAARFSLSPIEVSLVRFLHLYQTYSPLEAYFDKLTEWDALGRLARFCGAGEDGVLDAMGCGSVLVSSGVATVDGHGFNLRKRDLALGLPAQVLRYIADEGRLPLASFLLETPSVPCLSMPAFGLAEPTIAAARAVLSSTRGKPFLLLYGKPGTGKSEFARTLSASCGYTPCFLRHDRDRGGRAYPDMLLAARLVDPAREVLIVDEADEFLNLDASRSGFGDQKGGVRKGMINDFLDDSCARMIFITNETWRIPDSILRRFSFHLGFEDFSFTQRARIWNEMDDGSAMFGEADREVLAARYKANPSRIKQVFDVCASLGVREGMDGVPVLRVAEEMLSRGDELLHDIPRRERRPIKSYDPAFLNLGIPQDELLGGLRGWKASWLRDRRGISLLFHGAPGTGKTAFATYLAESLGFQPMVKRYGDLASPWVGLTERNIREAFKEAEGAVLIIDEADSLLSAREGARYGWERTQTNEVLTCMEEYSGVFIASTNFNSILDAASLRRFAFKVEFKPTAPAQRRRLVESYFPDISLPCAAWEEVEALDALTPGDVAAAADRLRYSAPGDGSRVLGALMDELESRASRSARIGFGA